MYKRQVEGNAAIAADDIIRAADLPLGSPMREVSEEKARAALKSSGTVELVSLEKHYPSLVVLNVRERRCDAVVSYAGVILTMERDGTVISQPSAMPETDAVYVTGLNVTGWQPGEVVSAPASQLEALVTTLDALYDNAATGYVSELNVSNPHALYLYSRTGMRVDLGLSLIHIYPACTQTPTTSRRRRLPRARWRWWWSGNCRLTARR